MSHSRIPVRYAKAFFSLGQEKNLLDIFRKDMETIAQTCCIKEFKYMLDSPILSTSEKNKAFTKIFSESVSQNTIAFLTLLIKKKRETFLPDVARDFIDLYKKHKGIKSVLFTSAFPIDASIREQITKTVKETHDSKIELHENVNNEIIGGFILKVDDQQWDASVSKKLKQAERELKQK
ncbi:MAG: ATP synthase F1 subunit delta [Bacteroidetes bacterium RIFOXYA12_FULL_35_11]|nr:MAG: ATP synthase F1 subunit delta [Bacteroidetes bacterium GWF2_35_48]OFY82223.1 MAG: ATP synthase F1 subunit delta [Bacteroidetes bacterium RIFOXYA12_FULL_35_11]OFY93246.1 MAG: ATP synthase F1 subunit delta [Bacteroidetes bacterium RIFOXYC12_FULL_35_7]HBX49701.1 ATP synthase F1 subunit delta [Bacteroidales bacterium]